MAQPIRLSDARSLGDFAKELELHINNASAAFDRVSGRDQATAVPVPPPAAIDRSEADPIAESARTAARRFSKKTEGRDRNESLISENSALIEREARAGANPTRAISCLNRVAAAPEKDNDTNAIYQEQLRSLIH